MEGRTGYEVDLSDDRVRSPGVRVLRFLNVADDALELTGCWINVNPAGSAHAVHTHSNNYLSGVYYVQTGSGANTINFHDPRLGRVY